MAKVGLTKITPVKAGDVKTITLNGVEVTVKQYLPMEEKTALVETVLNGSADDLSDFGVIKLIVYTTIEMIKAYTNISFTDKQLESIPKLYDAIMLNGIWDVVKEAIPESEFNFLNDVIQKEAKRLSTYFHSAMGVLTAIQSDYNSTSMDVDKVINKLKDGESMELVRDILTKVN